MIGKGKSIIHTGEALNYAIDKDQAQVIDKNMVIGDNGKEIAQEFRMFQDLNQRTEKNTLSFVLSPEPKQGGQLSNEDLKGISNDFLKKMGLENNQSIVVKHTDKAHTHLHVYVNRIDENGEAYKDNFIGKKSSRIADEVAKERGLTRIKDVQKSKELSTKLVRGEIKSISDKVMETKPKNFLDYSKKMEEKGVKILPTINKQGEMQGFRLEFKGMNFKASEVHRSMGLNQISLAINLASQIFKGVTQSIGRGL
jgi:hypothetical protein